jgi:uncharacterized protein (TIGR00255 family)
MTISSMTGFAREGGTVGPFQWAWELKSVNGRGLDVRVRTPPGLESAGEEARGIVAKALARGQVQLTLALTRGAGANRIRVNRDALASLLSALEGLELPASVRPASLDGLLQVKGIVEVEDELADPATSKMLSDALRDGAAKAVEALRVARISEGAALAEVLRGQLDMIEKFVEEADSAPGRRPEAVRARLEAQLAELLEGRSALDPMRLHQEAVLIATRADIREELDRLKAHIASARSLLQGGGPVGRRLDFLAQEFGREANTLCSKANDISLSRTGLELKAVVEQFREQVQNVE